MCRGVGSLCCELASSLLPPEGFPWPSPPQPGSVPHGPHLVPQGGAPTAWSVLLLLVCEFLEGGRDEDQSLFRSFYHLPRARQTEGTLYKWFNPLHQ